MTEYTVEIYLYDISRGFASNVSKKLIGKQISGIWHSSIVVYGKEYFFSNQVYCLPKGEFSKIKSLLPSKIINYGKTIVPEELFNERFEASKQLFTNENYDLLYHNCNHLSNYYCQFLLGKNIPDEIIEQHAEYANTEKGAKIISWIHLLEKYYRKMGGNFNPFG